MVAGSTCVVKENIRSGLLEIIQEINAGNAQYHEADYLYYKLDRMETILCQYAQLVDIDDRVFGCISEVKYLMRNEIQKGDENTDGFQCEKVFNGDRGRPRYNKRTTGVFSRFWFYGERNVCYVRLCSFGCYALFSNEMFNFNIMV